MQTFGPSVDGFHEVHYQMILDLRRRAETHFRRQEREKAAIRTVRAFEAHRARVRRNFMDAIGGLPTKRTPLKARVMTRTDRPKFTVENIIYESQPSFPVTASCYVPRGLTRRTPAVVFVCGHWDAGRLQETYQSVCIDLANNGLIVLAIDPVGQGERSQYFERGQRVIGSSVFEHTHAGLQFTVQGASIARHFIWDVMRGIDYLETRRDVDPDRIGITGNSGGGTQTSLLLMSDPRIAAAVPCTFIMTLESYMRTGQAQDAEQIVRGCMAFGPDHDDIITAIAPKPVLVGAVAYDFFPVEGSLEAVRRAKRVYKLYGRPENVDIFIDKSTHAYTPALREACVNWFRKHFLGERPNFRTGKIDLIPEKELQATKSGQIASDIPKARTVFDLNRELLEETTRPHEGRSLTAAVVRQRLDDVLGVSQAGNRRSKIYPRIISDTVVDGRREEKIFFFSAPEIVVTAVLTHPVGADAKKPLPTTLLLLDNGTEDIPKERARIEALLSAGQRVCIFDVRGTGAVQTRGSWSFEDGPSAIFNVDYKLGCDAMMLRMSTLGLRVFDALRGFDYLRTRGDVRTVHIAGVGRNSYVAWFAAALEQGFASVGVDRMLYSYRNACETRYHSRGLLNHRTMAWGFLRHFDLVDMLACLGGRPVSITGFLNARGVPAGRAEIQKGFTSVARRKGYRRPVIS